MIKAPFNFVPLTNKVYTPDWAEQISQDVPFSDGVSGYIDLTITALSPIFIRNGHTKEEAEQGKKAIENAIKKAKEANIEHPDFTEAKTVRYNSFCRTPDGSYYIPATSIKGEVRSLLEILTFSKMRVDKSMKFAQREWDNNILYPKQEIQKDLLCGFLKWDKEKGCYTITSHGKPYRIGFDNIDEYIKKETNRCDLFKRYFSDERGKDHREVTVKEGEDYDLNKCVYLNGKEFDPKTASFKYQLVGGIQLHELSFDIDKSSTKYSTRLKYNPHGEIKGDVVFTGQPGYCKWNRPTELDPKAGKFYEFVFPQQSEGKPIDMDEIDFNYFKFIYSESEEWPRIQKLLYEDSLGVPVFFRKKEMKDDNGYPITVIIDFGLAYMYKLPYEKSPQEILDGKYERYKKKLDMAECMFGTIGSRTDNTDSLKGRIQFTNCMSQNADEDAPMTLVLNSPKASYYPIYIKQEGKGGVVSFNYLTYNDGDLSGWKRYVVRNGDNNGTWSNKTGDPKLDTTLFPLKPKTTFSGKIYFHNLRPVELGALLSALTFHSTPECKHMLGQGKPYGLGKCKYDVCLHCKEREENMDYFMALFERTISKSIIGWRNSDTIKSLFTLSGSEVKADSTEYKYMTLSLNKDGNDFINAKKNKDGHNPEYLQDFISLQGGRVGSPNALTESQSQLEEKAKMVLHKMNESISKMIEDFERDLDSESWEEAKGILQDVRKYVNNPSEPVVRSEVTEFLELLNQKEQQIAERHRESEYNRYNDIYSTAHESNSLSEIDEAIVRLGECVFEEKNRWIEQLREKKILIERGTSDISTFLAVVKVASINAFATQLRKRNGITPIASQDISPIIQKLQQSWSSLKSSDRKTWLERKKWTPIEKEIGTELTDAIYEGIKGLPIK